MRAVVWCWILLRLAGGYLAATTWSLWYNLFLRMHPAVQIRGWIRVTGRVHWRVDPRATVILSQGVRINSGSRFNAVGGHRQTIIAAHKGAVIHLGPGSGLSSCTLVALRGIYVGEHVLIGGDCSIYDSDFHAIMPLDRLDPAGRDAVESGAIRIDRHAFIGSGALILKNVRVGEGAVVGARSVVTKDIPAGEVWAGCPAKRIRTLELEA